jgi:hypothetical protein
MTSDHLDRILEEVMLGKEPEVPDTPEEAKLRRQLEKEVDEILAAGGEVYLPAEIA